MEDLLKESAKQVPALVVVAGVCILFAKSGALVVKSFLAQMTEARGEYLKAIERFHSENMEARSLSQTTIQRNSTASDNQTEALHALTSEVKELRDALKEVMNMMRAGSK